jgi:hypothetical protein
MKIKSALIMSLLWVQAYGCNQSGHPSAEKNSNNSTIVDTMKIKITIGEKVFTSTVQNNATAKAFKAKLPLTINMKELNGNEKYFDLPDNFPANASNPGNVQAGDLMLYGSNTLVLFYKTFSTSYSYTRIARVDNASGLATALGSGNVTVTFELQ